MKILMVMMMIYPIQANAPNNCLFSDCSHMTMCKAIVSLSSYILLPIRHLYLTTWLINTCPKVKS